MKKAKAMQLVEALRSGKYEQGRQVLRRHVNKFCCLGVACDISESGLEWHPYDRFCLIGTKANYTHMYLPDEVVTEFDFYSSYGDRRDGKPILIGRQEFSSLAVANDCGCTFDQIADYIEENYKAL